MSLTANAQALNLLTFWSAISGLRIFPRAGFILYFGRICTASGPTYDLTFGEHRGYRNGQSLTIKERPDSWVQAFLSRSHCLGPLDMCQHCLLQLLLHFTSATQRHLILNLLPQQHYCTTSPTRIQCLFCRLVLVLAWRSKRERKIPSTFLNVSPLYRSQYPGYRYTLAFQLAFYLKRD